MYSIAQFTLLPIVLLSIASGILLSGTILYSYIYKFDSRPYYSGIILLGSVGFLYIICDIAVISFSIAGYTSAAMQFHRIEALSAAFYIFALPYFITYFLHLTPALQKSLRYIYRAGIVIIICTIIIAFIKPEHFLALSKTADTLITPWNRGRGTPGILYRFRDICIMIVALYSILMMIIELVIRKQNREIYFALMGAFIAVGSGLVDLSFTIQEMHRGLFTMRVFSYFGFGMATFIFLAMLGIMKRYIDQAREIERARKIESLGIMAGGIAHDFNNILTGILGNATLLNKFDNTNEDQKTFIFEIEKAAVRAQSLSSQLLTFAKGGNPIKDLTSIKELIIDMTEFILRGSKVRANFAFPDNLYSAHIDKHQMSQVIQNIILNAKEAMPEGGTIDIKAVNSKSTGILGAQKIGDYITITISDHGKGIPKKNLMKIFDPYFSTKSDGNGLGLSICWSIVKDHGGQLLVDSKPGEGTTFTIHIPASRKIQTVDSKDSEALNKVKGRVLFMDDEESIRNLAKHMFNKMGLTFLITECGEDAVDAFRKAQDSEDPFDLVIFDLTIPGGMGGRDALTAVRKLDSSIKAIIISGYINDDFFENAEATDSFDIIPKPFTYERFYSVVRRLLAQ